jgi:hypothetical protein
VLSAHRLVGAGVLTQCGVMVTVIPAEPLTWQEAVGAGALPFGTYAGLQAPLGAESIGPI